MPAAPLQLAAAPAGAQLLLWKPRRRQVPLLRLLPELLPSLQACGAAGSLCPAPRALPCCWGPRRCWWWWQEHPCWSPRPAPLGLQEGRRCCLRQQDQEMAVGQMPQALLPVQELALPPPPPAVLLLPLAVLLPAPLPPLLLALQLVLALLWRQQALPLPQARWQPPAPGPPPQRHLLEQTCQCPAQPGRAAQSTGRRAEGTGAGTRAVS